MDPVDQHREVADGYAIRNIGVGRIAHCAGGGIDGFSQRREGVIGGHGPLLTILALVGVANHAIFRVVAAAAVEAGAFGAGNAAELGVAIVAARLVDDQPLRRRVRRQLLRYQ